MFRTTLQRMLGLSAVILLVLGTAGSAAAHARYVRSVPAAGAQVSSVPAQVTAYFAEALDMAGSSLTVTNAAAATVSQGTAQQLTSDVKAMQIALQPQLGPGTYTVHWTTKSAADGDTASGSFTVTVMEAPVTTAGNSSTAPEGAVMPRTGTSDSFPALAAFAGLLLLAASLAVRRRSRGATR
jgi:copper transport protein